MTIQFSDTFTFIGNGRVRYDAQKLRRYIVERHGERLVFGGSAQSYFRAIGFCRRLAKMTGQTLDVTIQSIARQWEASAS